MALLHTFGSVTACPICTGPCRSFPDVMPFPQSAFQENPMDQTRGVPAPDRIFVDDVLAYAPGDVVPYDEAVELGLVDEVPDPVPDPEEESRARRGPVETTERRGPTATTERPGPADERATKAVAARKAAAAKKATSKAKQADEKDDG